MRRPRSLFGPTDYTVFTVEDILEHIEDWIKWISLDTVPKLRDARKATESAEGLLADDRREILRFVDRQLDLENRYESDLRGVASELLRGLKTRHVETVTHIAQSAVVEEKLCTEFKLEFLAGMGGEHRERLGAHGLLLDSLHRTARQQLVDLRDARGMARRLEALVEDAGEHDRKSSAQSIRLRLLAVWRRLKSWVSDRS